MQILQNKRKGRLIRQLMDKIIQNPGESCKEKN